MAKRDLGLADDLQQRLKDFLELGGAAKTEIYSIKRNKTYRS